MKKMTIDEEKIIQNLLIHEIQYEIDCIRLNATPNRAYIDKLLSIYKKTSYPDEIIIADWLQQLMEIENETIHNS